jgi:hypothetical protein
MVISYRLNIIFHYLSLFNLKYDTTRLEPIADSDPASVTFNNAYIVNYTPSQIPPIY